LSLFKSKKGLKVGKQDDRITMMFTSHVCGLSKRKAYISKAEERE
jgi:hypothetical protein